MKSPPSNGVASSARRLRQAGSTLLIGSLWMSTATAWAACQISQMEIPVRIVGHRPIATLTLNGTEVPMLIDSGAFFSMLSASTAAELKLPLRSLPPGYRVDGYTGRIEAKQTRVETVGLLGAELSNVSFLVGGNELGEGIMGILGRNILSAADTEYDLARGAVRLSFPKGDCETTNFAHWAGNAPVVILPLEDQRRGATAIRVHVSVNGARTLALLDTGAPTTSLTLGTARRAGIEQRDLTPVGRIGGAGAGRVKSWSGPVAQFEVGGEKIEKSRLRIDDADADEGAIVGLDYFLSHRIYVSRLQEKVYVTWNGSPVFAQGGASADEDAARYAALPQAPSADDADALARRGAAALATGNYERALEDLNRACELAPGVADYFYGRARVHLATRKFAPALADLDESLRLNSELAEARVRRAFVRSELGDRAGAQADLAQLDSTLPPSSHLRSEMGLLYANLRQAPESVRQYDLWIGSHPNDARISSALNGRCWLRARMNIDLPLALEDCKAAIDKDSGDASYRDSLGWTYLRLGDAASAKKAFDGAIKIEALPFSLYGRALANLRLNDTADSERDLAAARRLKPQIDEEVRKEGFEFATEVQQLKPAIGS